MKVPLARQKEMLLRHCTKPAGTSWMFNRVGPIKYAQSYGRLQTLKADGDLKLQQVRLSLPLGDNVGRLLKNAGLVERMYTSWQLASNNTGLETISRRAAFNRGLAALTERSYEAGQLPQPPYVMDVAVDLIEMLDWYRKLETHENPCYWLSLMRPLIYWDLLVNGHIFLGRLVFEMYTECAPDLVWDFVRTSSMGFGGFYKFLTMSAGEGLLGQKEFPRRFLDTFKLMNIESGRYLSHNDHDGLLSVCQYDMNRLDEGIVTFNVSFARNPRMDNYCYPIGRVVDGIKHLKTLVEMPMPSGISMVGCGWKM